MPASKSPSSSNNRAPSFVRYPAFSPADSTLGKREGIEKVKPSSFALREKASTYSLFQSFVSLSIGNIPEASPIPITFSPVSR